MVLHRLTSHQNATKIVSAGELLVFKLKAMETNILAGKTSQKYQIHAGQHILNRAVYAAKCPSLKSRPLQATYLFTVYQTGWQHHSATLQIIDQVYHKIPSTKCESALSVARPGVLLQSCFVVVVAVVSSDPSQQPQSCH